MFHCYIPKNLNYWYTLWLRKSFVGWGHISDNKVHLKGLDMPEIKFQNTNKILGWSVMVEYACNLSTRSMEKGGSLGLVGQPE